MLNPIAYIKERYYRWETRQRVSMMLELKAMLDKLPLKYQMDLAQTLSEIRENEKQKREYLESTSQLKLPGKILLGFATVILASPFVSFMVESNYIEKLCFGERK